MKKKSDQIDLSRNTLETLTSSQLIDLADEYGIDIPDNLNRQFIIEELIEVAKEIDENSNYKETIKVSDDAVNTIATELPESYNETKIDVMLRNPVSLFVYWDFSEVQLKQLKSNKISIYLQISFFDSMEAEKPEDTFEIQINIEDREQYILIPGGKKFVRVDLMQNTTSSMDAVLAVSSRLSIPQGSEEFMNFHPGENLKIKPILTIDSTGKLQTIDKKRGDKQAMLSLIERFDASYDPDMGNTVYISCADCKDVAESLKSKLLEKYPDLDIKITMLSPIIGAHTGPDMLSLIYYGSKRAY